SPRNSPAPGWSTKRSPKLPLRNTGIPAVSCSPNSRQQNEHQADQCANSKAGGYGIGMNTKPKRSCPVAVYVRVSTAFDQEKGLKSQEQAIAAYLAGHDLEAVFY